MHKILVLALAVVIGGQALFAGAPSAEALSCLDFEESLAYSMKSDTTKIFVGEPLKEKRDADNVAQLIDISKPLIGAVYEQEWVHYPIDSDWGYMCASGPNELNTGAQLYVVSESRDPNTGQPARLKVEFRVQVNSEAYDTILEAVADAKKSKDFRAPKIWESTSEERGNEVEARMKALIRELTLLLEELRYWRSQ